MPIQRGATQSSFDLAEDERTCAKSRAGGSYEACMVARGYRVSLHVIGRGAGAGAQTEPDLTMNVETTKTVEPDSVGSDLALCKIAVRSAWSEGEKALFTMTGVLFGAYGAVAAPDTLDRLAGVYSACMEPRGYKTSLWDPRYQK